jgi:hypothetical protein
MRICGALDDKRGYRIGNKEKRNGRGAGEVCSVDRGW